VRDSPRPSPPAGQVGGRGGYADDAASKCGWHRCQSNAEALWQEAQPGVSPVGGMLVLDDSTLDKFYARMIELVTRHWSGKHHRVVQGINLISLLARCQVPR
jgi:hypothetical protein